MKRQPQDRVFTAAENQLYFAAEDFEKVGRNILVGNEMTLIANLPYGHRSREVSTKSQLISTYKRFNAFLKEEKERFRNTYILVPSESTFHPNHFLTVSDLPWTLKNVYDSGGKQVGLYEL